MKAKAVVCANTYAGDVALKQSPDASSVPSPLIPPSLGMLMSC